MEKPSTDELVRLHKIPFLLFDVLNLLDGKAELLLFHVDGLKRVAFAAHLNSREKRGVGLECGLDGAAETLGVEAAVKNI